METETLRNVRVLLFVIIVRFNVLFEFVSKSNVYRISIIV